jgi:RNA polymerase sigma factor (sigma-70 family)
MSPFGSKKSKHRVETAQDPEGTPERVLVIGDVTVIVRDVPPPEPRREPEPPERSPRAIILPLDQPDEDREAFIRGLGKEHVAFIREILRHRADVLPESKKDLEQRVVTILWRCIEEKRVPRDVEGFIVEIVRREVANHKRRKKPEIDEGADASAVASDAPTPESALELAERGRELEGYLAHLSKEQAEVVRCVELYELTLEQTAQAVGRPLGTVSSQLTRARKLLKELGRKK